MSGPQLAREAVRMYLHWAAATQQARAVLSGMYQARLQEERETPEEQALLEGCVALGLRNHDVVEKLRERGGLLHLGCARVTADEGCGHVVVGGLAP